MVAANDLLESIAGALVACRELVGVDLLQLRVGVFDEVFQEEDCWVWVWWLGLWMGIKGSVLLVRFGDLWFSVVGGCVVSIEDALSCCGPWAWIIETYSISSNIFSSRRETLVLFV